MVTTTAWIKQNKDLVVTIFKVAAGMVVGGSALVALGYAIPINHGIEWEVGGMIQPFKRKIWQEAVCVVKEKTSVTEYTHIINNNRAAAGIVKRRSLAWLGIAFLSLVGVSLLVSLHTCGPSKNRSAENKRVLVDYEKRGGFVGGISDNLRIIACTDPDMLAGQNATESDCVLVTSDQEIELLRVAIKKSHFFGWRNLPFKNPKGIQDLYVYRLSIEMDGESKSIIAYEMPDGPNYDASQILDLVHQLRAVIASMPSQQP